MAHRVPKQWITHPVSTLATVTRGIHHVSSSSTSNITQMGMLQQPNSSMYLKHISFQDVSSDIKLLLNPSVSISYHFLHKGQHVRQFSTNSESSKSNVMRESKPKSEKSNTKEFKVKSTIGAHDLGIKINQMQNLLGKGKTVHIIFRLGGQSESFKSDTATFLKKISADLQDICTIKQEFSNEKAVKFILSPTPKEEES